MPHRLFSIFFSCQARVQNDRDKIHSINWCCGFCMFISYILFSCWVFTRSRNISEIHKVVISIYLPQWWLHRRWYYFFRFFCFYRWFIVARTAEFRCNRKLMNCIVLWRSSFLSWFLKPFSPFAIPLSLIVNQHHLEWTFRKINNRMNGIQGNISLRTDDSRGN